MLSEIKTYYTRLKQKILPNFYIGFGTVILLTSIVLIFGLTIWWLNQNSSLQHIWETFAFDKKIPASFCEKIGISNPVRQPINTFSNIIYLIASIIIFKRSWKESHNGDTHDLNTPYSYLLALILFYVFCASTFYHASLINLAHKFDYSAVFSFSLFPVIFFLHSRWLDRNNNLSTSQKRQSFTVFFITFLATNLFLSFLIPKEKESIAVLIIILVFLGLAIVNILAKPGYPGRHYLILSVSSILIALLWFEFDKNKVLCNPGSYFQPHGLWNIFVGSSAFYFFLYINSQQKNNLKWHGRNENSINE